MQGNQPLAIIGTLLIVYIVLGVLYESYMHPLTILSTLPSAGVGALLALRMLETEFSLIAMLGLFLLVGVVMKNAILMIDVALQFERERSLTPYEADPRSVPAAPAADPDDDDGGDARRDAADARHGRGRGTAQAAGHRDRRRPDLQPGADALHDARSSTCIWIDCVFGARIDGRSNNARRGALRAPNTCVLRPSFFVLRPSYGRTQCAPTHTRPYRSAARAFARAAHSSRSRGAADVTSESISRRATAATSSTA